LKWEVNKTKVDTADELLDRILDVAACINKREDQLRRTTRDLRTRVAKCTEVDGGIFEYLLRTVTDLSLLCHKFLVKHEIKI
jgi:hypothetical protein